MMASISSLREPIVAADSAIVAPASAPAAEPVADAVAAAETAPAGARRVITFVPARFFATSFGFCFGMREGMLLVAGMQAVTAVFWLFALGLPPSPLRAVTLGLLLLNAALAALAVKTKSEGCAATLIATFGLLTVLLLTDLVSLHPPACSNADVIDNKPLGSLISHLLWSADACLLMSILGWVSAGTVGGVILYMWYMCMCFWRTMRLASADMRRVRRAIAALPSRKYQRHSQRPVPEGESEAVGSSSRTSPLIGLAASAAEGEVEEEDEGATCAICLCDFEDGDEVRLLPCYHEFCKEVRADSPLTGPQLERIAPRTADHPVLTITARSISPSCDRSSLHPCICVFSMCLCRCSALTYGSRGRASPRHAPCASVASYKMFCQVRARGAPPVLRPAIRKQETQATQVVTVTRTASRPPLLQR